tara:strand:- start:2668 stop:5769 length:3102 start_codon:yes stop_codon:yes gene_type:complete
MNFIDYSVKKFITIISIFLLSFIFGLISLQSIPVQLVPTVEKPKITIRTNWQGASPEEIEREIVIRQEDKLKSLEGLELMESTSIENQATIKLELKEGRNIESSLIQVSNLLAQVKDIPADSDKPTIKSISSDRSPIAWFILKAKKNNINIFEYKDFAEDYIKTRFERVEGVGESGIRGGRFKEVQIDIDTNKLAFLEVSLLDIVNEIKKNNIDISSGAIEEGKRKYTARTTGEIKSINDLKKIIIKEDNNNYISLGDISKINVGYEDENYIVRHLGENAIAINVIKETGANTIEVHKELLIAMNELNDGPLNKENLILTNVYSDTTYIDASISSVKQNLFLGALLAILVLLFFLKSLKTTLIIALAIPISTVSSFIIFEFMGRTLNLISLAGISFAVGMVVDNSLVVLENIFSKFESGVKDPKKAAIEGAKEVAGAILASTMTTFAVFLPILFLTSEIGQLFKDIALSISISIIISFFVSLTFIPGLASKILDYDSLSDLGGKKKLFTKFDNIGIFFNQKINSLLNIILQKSQNLLKFLIIILSSTLLLFFLTFPKLEYLPEGNRNLIISVLIPPQGYNIDKIKKIGSDAESKIKKYWQKNYKGEDKIKNFFFVARPKSVFMGAVADNPKNIKKLIPILKNAGKGFPGFITIVNQSSLFSRSIGERRAIDIDIKGKNYETIVELSKNIFVQLRSDFPEYQIRPKPSLSNSNPEIIIRPKNLKLNQVGMTADELGLITNIILDGARISKYNDNGKEIDIKLRGNSPKNISSNMLSTRFIYNNDKFFPLSFVSDISIINSPQQINHVERDRTIKLQVSPDEKTNIEDALSLIKKSINTEYINKFIIDNNIEINLRGIAGKLEEAKSSLSKNFIYALLISFFLLSSLFQSFIYPLIVLTIVPLSSLAGIYGLKIMNIFSYEPLNMLSMLGFIILLGIVVNNSILIVYKSLNNIREGLSPTDSVKFAVKKRIRPIFMTTLTTSFGLLPLAIIPGAGAELYRGLAVIILSGLLISTIFTLFLTPMAIIVINRFFKIK